MSLGKNLNNFALQKTSLGSERILGGNVHKSYRLQYNNVIFINIIDNFHFQNPVF